MAGALARADDGSVIAVYTDGGCLIKNTGNREEAYPLPFGDGADPGNIAVSPDCAYAAVSYRPDGSGTDWIGLVDLADGTVSRTYDTGYVIQGYAFAPDGASLLITCFGEHKIARIDLETGAIEESAGYTYSIPFSIVPYEDRILVCDTDGLLTVYNDALKQVGDYRVIGGSRIQQKQLAVSKKYDCLLTAGRGGNVLGGSQRISLSSDRHDSFVPASGEEMVSTTSVAITDGGEYAAYGNAGGSVGLYLGRGSHGTGVERARYTGGRRQHAVLR